MRKMELFVAVTVVALGFWGCLMDGGNFVGLDDLSDGDQNRSNCGEYSYSGYDSQGTLIIRGALTIMREDTLRVTGTWKFEAAIRDSLGMFGPQVGSGNLVGSIHGDNIGLNLNPNYVDNNVLLAGTISYWGISGTWEYVGFPGVLNRGTFRAVRSP